MQAILKQKIKFGKLELVKGTTGKINGVTNSAPLKKELPCLVDGDDYYYIVEFPGVGEFLLDKSKIDIS
jgi:hypothetical protein